MHIPYPSRAHFAKEIIAEFRIPKKDTGKVIMFASGVPGMPHGKYLLDFWARRGYWCFLPRYRGSWESDGIFLEQSPHTDILDCISQLSKGFVSVWDEKKYKVMPKQVIVIGGSFGGAASLLCAEDERVSKVVALSPVVDWRVDSPEEPFADMYAITRDAFGMGYRMPKKNFFKLQTGKFYNPASKQDRLPGRKILIIHPKDDKVVPVIPSIAFARYTKSKLVTPARGGHLGISSSMEPGHIKILQAFLKQK